MSRSPLSTIRLAGLVPLSLAVLFASACTESYDLTLSYETEAVPQRSLTIDNIEGSVRLQRGPANTPVRGTIKVRAAGFDKEAQAQTAAQAVRVVETMNGPDMVLTPTIPEQYRRMSFALTFDLTVPEGVAVSVVTDNGRISVNGLPILTLDTTNAPIDLAFTSAPAGETSTLKTNDGAISADSHEGPLDASTSNAELRLFSVAGSTRATTTQGFIEARVFPPVGGDIFLATTNNHIDLSISRDFGARLVAATTAPGAIAIDGSLPFIPSGSYPDQAQGTLGDGRGRIDVRTTQGDIFIGR